MKLLVEDVGGRRRKPLQGKELLVRPGPTTMPSGVIALHAASQYAVKAQRAYAEFFGRRELAGRSLARLRPKQALQQAERLGRPGLGSRRHALSATSEAAKLRAHQGAVARIVETIQAGGPLGCVIGGQLPSPAAVQPALGLMADEAARMTKLMAASAALSQKRGQMSPEPASSSRGGSSGSSGSGLVSSGNRSATQAATCAGRRVPVASDYGKKCSFAEGDAKVSLSRARKMEAEAGGLGKEAQKKKKETEGQTGKKDREGPTEGERPRKKICVDAGQAAAAGADAAKGAFEAVEESEVRDGNGADVSRQVKVAAMKEAALAAATPGLPTRYVCPNAGHMRPSEGETGQTSPAAPRVLPAHTVLVRLGHGCRKLPPGCDRRFLAASTGDVPHVVAVGTLTQQWDSHVALLARLHGLWLVDAKWMESKGKDGHSVCFESVISQQHMVLYLGACFRERFPKHAQVLVSASKHAPKIKNKRGLLVPRFHVIEGDRPEKVDYPRLTFGVVAKVAEQPQPAYILDLAQLLKKCTALCAGSKFKPPPAIASQASAAHK